MKVDLKLVEEAAKDLYIRALKILPDDVKQRLRPPCAQRDRAARAGRCSAR